MKTTAAILTTLASIANGSKSASDSTRITYFVKHQPQHVKHLLDTLQGVSDPRNDKYGQYLTLETVQALQQPLESDIAAVRAHIKRAGGVEVSSSAATDKIIADVPLDFVQTELTELFVHCDIVSGLPRTEASVQRIAMEKEAKTFKLKHRHKK